MVGYIYAELPVGALDKVIGDDDYDDDDEELKAKIDSWYHLPRNFLRNLRQDPEPASFDFLGWRPTPHTATVQFLLIVRLYFRSRVKFLGAEPES